MSDYNPSKEREQAFIDREAFLKRINEDNVGPPGLGLIAPTAPPRMAPRATSLLPQSTSLPQASDMETANDNSLDDVASLISKKDNVPVDWLVYDVINPMAYVESAKTMDPKAVQGNNGTGRGMLQFEGTMGVKKQAVHNKNVKDYLGVKGNNVKVGDLKVDIDNKPVMGKDSFELAVTRAKDFYTKIAEKKIPSWITNIKNNTNASDLTSNQQRALGLLNIKMQKTSSFKNLYKNFNDDTLGKFWKKHHHKGKPNETSTTAANRKENFKSLQKSFQQSGYSLRGSEID